jgi:molecular chaperone Hsp33
MQRAERKRFMDKIIRCITSDGAVMASAIDASDIVFTAKKLHHLSRSATAALGRLLCATSMMGAQLKQKDAIINLRVMGDGELGPVIAVGDSKGNVRGYVGNSECPTDYYPNGKINVSKAVGKNGTISVMRDYGSGEPYIGQVELVSGEIAEDVTNYYATSEQIPTVCALGVLINKDDGEVMLAGGLLIQLLPGAFDDTIDKLEKNLEKLEPVTTMLAKGMSILDICKTALEGFEVEVLDEYPVNYVCTCSKEKLEKHFCTMSDEDIRSLPDETGRAVATCHFCNKKYIFTKSDLEKLIEEKNSK